MLGCIFWNIIIVSFCRPLNTRQDSCHIVCWRPPVLQDIQTQLSRRINIWMKHLTDELDCRWLVRVLFLKVHNESEGSVLEGSVGWSDNDSVPVKRPSARLLQAVALPEPKICLPSHNIVRDRRRRYASWGVCLHALGIQSVRILVIVCRDEEAVATNLEIAHQAASSSSRHDGRYKSDELYKYSINGCDTLGGGKVAGVDR